jgi:hypothetical protein
MKPVPLATDGGARPTAKSYGGSSRGDLESIGKSTWSPSPGNLIAHSTRSVPSGLTLYAASRGPARLQPCAATPARRSQPLSAANPRQRIQRPSWGDSRPFWKLTT